MQIYSFLIFKFWFARCRGHGAGFVVCYTVVSDGLHLMYRTPPLLWISRIAEWNYSMPTRLVMSLLESKVRRSAATYRVSTSIGKRM